MEVTYGIVSPTTVSGLAPNDHTICVQATGSNASGDVQDVTECHIVDLLQLTASPALEVDELGEDNEHTVTAAIVGGTGDARDITFVVGGQNALTATPPNAALLATPNVPVNFVYTVPQTCLSLGEDTITVSTVIAESPDSVEVKKVWQDPRPGPTMCGDREPAWQECATGREHHPARGAWWPERRRVTTSCWRMTTWI